uniref:Uncharacterized protein n=1 Tax=Schistocephalus solidus TaxID=70667 RepID=A0A0V0J8T6_SCHSO
MAFKELQLQCLLYTKVAHFELLTVLSLFNIMAKFMYSFLFIYAVVFISYGVTELNDVNSKNGTTSDGSNGSADNTTRYFRKRHYDIRFFGFFKGPMLPHFPSSIFPCQTFTILE